MVQDEVPAQDQKATEPPEFDASTLDLINAALVSLKGEVVLRAAIDPQAVPDLEAALEHLEEHLRSAAVHLQTNR